MGTVPKALISLRPVHQATEDLFNSLTFKIAKNGTQTCDGETCQQTSLPNMQEIIMDIASSVQSVCPRYGCSHIILLSPKFNMLHELSGTFPGLRMHQINPAVIPFPPNKGEYRECLETCCQNYSSGTWTNYQSTSSCIQECISMARSRPPTGILTNIHVGLRPSNGCEIIRIDGTTSMEALQMGQAFSFLAHVRVSPSQTSPIDSDSDDPLFQDSLNSTSLRQELHVAEMLDATLADLLTVQVFYKNSLSLTGTWSYTEAPLVVVKHLGGLPFPHDDAQDIYKRQVFHIVSKSDSTTAEKELIELSMEVPHKGPELEQVIADTLKELKWQRAALGYETAEREKRPTRTGSIGMLYLPYSR